MPAPDYAHIAREIMENWQKQLVATANDKEFIGTMLEWFSTLQDPALYAKKTTAATAARPDHADDALTQLAFRLEQCEKRLGALETSIRTKPKAAKRPARGSRKPRR